MKHKLLLLLCLFALLTGTVKSQLFNQGVGNTNGLVCVTSDILGNIYRGGMQGYPGTEWVLEKYYANGTLAWSTQDGGSGPWGSRIKHMKVDDNTGDIYALVLEGDSTYIGGVLQLTNGSGDPYIMKFNNQGVLQWFVRVNEYIFADPMLELVINPAGNPVFLSHFQNTVTVGATTVSSAGTHPYWAEFSSAGTVLNVTYASATQTGMCATMDSNGNVYFVGSDGAVNLLNKYNPSTGATTWSMPIAAGTGYIYDVAVDGSGNVYATGEFDGSFTWGSTYTSFSMWDDIILFKANASGVFQWIKQFGGQGVDDGYEVVTDPAGNIYIAGFFELTGNFDALSVSSVGGYDLYFAKLDPSGNVLWVTSGGGPTPEIPCDLDFHQVTGKLLFGGVGNSTSTFQFGSLAFANTYGFWLDIMDGACSATGKVFRDFNGNGSLDAGESGFPNRVVTMSPGNAWGVSGIPGNYALYSMTGNYTVSLPQTPLYHTLTSATTQPASFTVLGQVDSLNHFALQPTPNMNDLVVNIVPINYGARSGMGEMYALWYENVGTTDITNATLSLSFDTGLTYGYSSPSYTYYNGTDSITFSFDTLSVGEQGFAFLVLYIPTSLPIGSPLQFDAYLTPAAGDQTPANNHYSFTHSVVNSYDPNEKSVFPEGDLTPAEAAAGTRLTYTLRFQNTGNDVAYFVRLVDTLSSNLDLSTFQFQAESHTSSWNIDQNRVLTVDFYGINLPDSTTDEFLSHGFFQYSVEPLSSLVHGDQVANTCAIYFDFNPPIVTNTVVTNILDPNGVENGVNGGGFSVFPQPAQDYVIFRNENAELIQADLRVVNLQGQTVGVSRITGRETRLQINGISSGIYIYQIGDGDGVNVQRGRIVVE